MVHCLALLGCHASTVGVGQTTVCVRSQGDEVEGGEVGDCDDMAVAIPVWVRVSYPSGDFVRGLHPLPAARKVIFCCERLSSASPVKYFPVFLGAVFCRDGPVSCMLHLPGRSPETAGFRGTHTSLYLVNVIKIRLGSCLILQSLELYGLHPGGLK